jgi:hypothetical protein
MIFCEIDMTDYTPRLCGTDFAGVVGIGLIDDYEEPSTTDLQDPDFWIEKLSEANKKYHVIRNTRGQYQDIQPIEEEDLVGYLVTGVNHTATIDVPEVKENRDFWEAVKLKNWKLCLITSGDLLLYIDKPVTFIPKIVNPKGIKDAAYFQVEMKWADLSNPYILEAPEGIFTGAPLEIDETTDGIFDYTFDETFG